MANIFDIDVKLSGGKDQNVDTHLLNEQFHVFSKSPSSAATSLGSASNRSGHTVTATDVWAEEIPAFYEVPDMESTASLNPNENDLCRVGNGVAIYKNGAWSLEYASYMDIPDGHEFVNASGKPVIRFHKNRLARNLTVKNNAADDGLNSSAKIQGWDKDAQAPYEYVEAAPKFVSQFVTSTDKIVDGKPSKGYGPFVMAGTTSGDITKVLNEGTVDDNDYVANSFAGIIQYNKKRTDAIYVHAFEYCGHSLKTAYSDIEELSDIISKISVTAKGGLQGVSEDATTAGLSTKWVKLVDGKEVAAQQTDPDAYPVLTITTGSVDGNDNAKLVTGSAVQTYVDEAVEADGAIGEAISGAIEDATLADTTAPDKTSIEAAGTEDASKLVTVSQVTEYVTDYVAENAKVTVNSKANVQDITIQSGSTLDKTNGDGTVTKGDLVQIDVKQGKSDPDGSISLNISAVVNTAAWDEEKQEITDENALLVAGVAQQVINQTIINQITEVIGEVPDGETPTIGTAIEKAIEDATLADTEDAIANSSSTGKDPTDKKLVTAEQVKDYVVNHAQVTVKSGSTSVTSTGFEFVGAGTATDDIIVSSKLEEVTGTDNKKTGKVTYSATLTKATIDSSTGAIKDNSGNFVVSASDAEKIATAKAQAEIEAAVGAGEVIDSHISDVLAENTATLETSGAIKDGDDDKFITAKDAETLAQNAANAIDTGLMSIDTVKTNGIGLLDSTAAGSVKVSVTPATYTKKDGNVPGSWSSDSLASGYFTTAQSVSDAIADAVSSIVIPEINLSGNSKGYGIHFTTEESEGSGSSHYMHIATAQYMAGHGGADSGSWDTNTKGYLVTASTVETFVTDEVSKVATDLAALETKVDNFHKAGVSYKVLDTLPDPGVAYNGVIVLVPSVDNGKLDEKEAMSGSYVEHLCVNKGTDDAPQWVWEQIGTTEADLKNYVRMISEGQASGTLANQGSVYANITSEGYLSIGVASATDSVMGVSKLFSGHYEQMASVTNKSNTAVSLETVSEMFTRQDKTYAKKDEVVSSVNGVKGDIKLCVHNGVSNSPTPSEGEGTGMSTSTHANLWGTGVFTNSDYAEQITIVDSFVGLPWHGNDYSYLQTAALPSNAVTVENNFVMNADGKVITTIRPERMVSGFVATIATGLTSFVGDLNNLETSSTFYNHTAIETFIGDLSSLKEGSQMFSGCHSLTTFIGDLSSLEIGTGSLSTDASGMFQKTALTVESVENIADALPENPVVSTSTNKGCIAISWNSLTSDTAERQELVDALSGVLDKGWVLVTNSVLHPMFDTDKYQVVQSTVQPLDLEGEPQEIAYVIKK